MPLLDSPPREVCLLRVSAIGDTCHVVPLLRTLQAAWPEARFTWVIGKLEAKLMRPLLPEVDFITFDKRAGLRGLLAARRELAARTFDLLLHLQVAFRASLLAQAVRAPVKLGFDHARAREGQAWFTTHRTAPLGRVHVLDSLINFATALGITEHRLQWNLPLPPDALAYADALVPAGTRAMVISPCSSHGLRNWRAERYAAVAEHAVRVHGLKVIVCGGPSDLEHSMAADIAAKAQVPVLNQVGRDTLPQLLALLDRACVLLTPDSGPAHMATMVGTPVLGLYAATNPQRSGPYLSREWCANRYADAAARFRHATPETLPWTTKIEVPGVMDLITVEEVTDLLDRLLARR
ncbi:MAG: glycosyltransferase family 9 protein [Gammaproteobacteria bacterium]